MGNGLMVIEFVAKLFYSLPNSSGQPPLWRTGIISIADNRMVIRGHKIYVIKLSKIDKVKKLITHRGDILEIWIKNSVPSKILLLGPAQTVTELEGRLKSLKSSYVAKAIHDRVNQSSNKHKYTVASRKIRTNVLLTM